MADPIHTCDACGRQYTARRKRKNCTRQCAKATYRGKVWAGPRWPDGVPESHKTYTCRVCGVDFKPKRAGRNRYCSKSCVAEWLRYRAMIKRTGGRVSVVVTLAHCESCGRLHKRRQTQTVTCSAFCAKTVREPRTCAECGESFVPKYGSKLRVYCSASCRKRAVARVSKATRRAREKALPCEPVNHAKVFERDKWRCCLCGVKTPIELRGTKEPNAPELDHIIPLAKGGSHTYANVQCACRKCNGQKGDQILGQLRLFGGIAA